VAPPSPTTLAKAGDFSKWESGAKKRRRSVASDASLQSDASVAATVASTVYSAARSGGEAGEADRQPNGTSGEPPPVTEIECVGDEAVRGLTNGESSASAPKDGSINGELVAESFKSRSRDGSDKGRSSPNNAHDHKEKGQEKRGKPAGSSMFRRKPQSVLSASTLNALNALGGQMDMKTAIEITDTGAALCDVAFVFGVRQHATLMAREPTSCLALSRYDYKSIMGEFPTEARRVQDNVLEQVKMRGSTADATADELNELIEQRRQGALFELLNAASDGEVETVRALLTDAESVELHVDACDYDKRTALHVAASEGQVSVVEALLKEGAEVNVRDRWGGTPLADAIRQGAERVVDILLGAKGQLGYTEAQTASVLCEYAKEGRKEAITQLLKSGGNVDACDYDKRTSLHLAASEGNDQIVSALLERGATINVKDRWGGTPLRDAVREGHIKVVRLLRDNGGLLSLTTSEVSSELCEASRSGYRHVVEALLAAGAPVNAADYDLRTCLHLAASEGNYPIVDFLTSVHADVNAKDRWGGTPLCDALRDGHRKVAMLLHTRGGRLSEHDPNKPLAQLTAELTALMSDKSLMPGDEGASV